MSFEIISNHFENWDDKIVIARSYYAHAEIKPQPKQSTQFVKRIIKKKKAKFAFTPKKKLDYINSLIDQFTKTYTGPKILGVIRISVVYSFAWKKGDFKSLGWIFKKSRPDCDNLGKPVLDALHNIAFIDDSQIVELRTRKIHSEIQGVFVRIDEIKPNRLAEKK